MKTYNFKIITLMLLALLSGCAEKKKAQKDFFQTYEVQETCDVAPAVDDPAKEDVLIIGDSISYGYTPFVTTNLSAYEVVHTACSGRNSVNGMRYIDEWLNYRPHYKAIIFNFGIWDTWNPNITIPMYTENIRTITAKILDSGLADHVYFAQTTLIIDTSPKSVAIRSMAESIMIENNIPIIDLYTLSTGLSSYRFDGVHYTDPAYQIIGDFISTRVLQDF